MFDAKLRPLIDPSLNRMAQALAARGAKADHLTILSGLVGVAAGVAIGFKLFLAGLALIVLSRLLDGLDGAVARATETSDFGGYLDIVADFFFYVSVPLGFAAAAQGNAPFALALVASFALTGVSFLSFAAIAAKRGEETDAHGKKSFFYSTGIAEGAETIAVFILMCIVPDLFPVLAAFFTLLCLATVAQRTLAAHRAFAKVKEG